MSAWRVIQDVHAGASIRPTRAEVDLAAVAGNAALLRRVGGVELWAVVKADAYGHGAVACARALEASGQVAGFAVSLVEEGVELREAGIRLPILVMGPSLAGGHEELCARDLTALVSDEGDLEVLAAIGRRRACAVAVHLKVDTGMSRLGIPVERVAPAVARCLGGDGLALAGLATHFACADGDDPADADCATAHQLARFRAAAEAARAAGARVLALHAANSAALLRFPAARMDRARPGLALYGNGGNDASLRQAMRLVSAITQLRALAPGGAVSYGGLWRASRPSRLAVVPVGYADGLPRSLTGKAEALVRGRRVPIVGAISMDISILDVTDLPEAEVGDEVVLLGAQGRERISTAEFAGRAGVTEYEVTCGISRRVPREYA